MSSALDAIAAQLARIADRVGGQPPSEAESRARFELWATEEGYSRHDKWPSGKYLHGPLQGKWLAWQAALRAFGSDRRR